jgi:putative nucleotidyltransferase with HDIG domain
MKLEALFDQTHLLPTIPKVVQELINSFERDDPDIDELAHNIGLDQVITAKVLRLANSAHYGSPRSVASIDDAVVLLGFNTVRTLVIASGVSGAGVNIPGFDRSRFWKHSFEVAATAKWLARQVRQNPDTAFTAGLLHNIGELLIHIVLPREAVSIDMLVDASGADRVVIEDHNMGFDYTMVGSELARRWNFPETIQHAIREQHNPLESDPFKPLSGIVAIASYLIDALDHDYLPEQVSDKYPRAVSNKLGLHTDAVLAEINQLKPMAAPFETLLN